MASETVTIYCYDEQQTPQLVDGVLIRVFDSGDVFVTQDYTGNVIPGAVEFTLDGDDPPITYTIRMSKTGMAFDGSLGDQSKSPQLIDIWSPPGNSPTGTNDFDVYGETFILPTAADARLCRCSGFFVRPTGIAYSDMQIEIHNQLTPTIADNQGVMKEIINISADSAGYIEVDLYREGEYKIWLRGLDTTPRDVYIPASASTSLIHLLFPVISQVVYAPTSVSIAVDEEVDVVPTVSVSDGRTLDDASIDDVTYTVADEDVAIVSVGNDKLVITGVSTGSTTLSATRMDESIVIVPDSGVTQTPLSITVS